MKKIILSSALVIACAAFMSLLFPSCTASESDLPAPAEQPQAYSASMQKRTLDEAIAIAQNASATFERKGGTRAAVTKTVDRDMTDYVVNRSTRSAAGCPDTLIYVLNFENNGGFALVSANKATEGLLAYVEEGSYDASTVLSNPSFGYFQELAESYVSLASVPMLPDSLIGEPFKERRTQRDTVNYQSVGPYVTVKWGQKGVFGYYAPNQFAGCVNTAMVQIMSHFKYPTYLAVNYPNASVSSVTMNWNAQNSHIYAGNWTPYSQDYYTMAHFTRQIGHLTNSDYSSPDGTSSTLSNARNAFIGLGYSVTPIQSFDASTICSHISSTHLVQMLGNNASSPSTTGHFWIVDGYKHFGVRCREWERSPTSGQLDWELVYDRTSYETYLHINWGWNGSCNGYFSNGVFKTAHARTYDTPGGNSTDYIYNNALQYIVVSR